MSNEIIDWYFHHKIISEGNNSDFWVKKNKRKKDLQKLIFFEWINSQKKLPYPATITLIRISPRNLDYDNLVFAFKRVRDYVSYLYFTDDKIGSKDNDPNLTWEYKQEKGTPKEYAFRVKISN